MKIINRIEDATYIQWVEKFVNQIIQKSKISCKEVIIEDIEHSRHIFLSIDGEEYDIRTWNFHSIGKDENNQICAEKVDYTLFRMVKDDTGSHGEEICKGFLKIEWKN